MLDRNVKALVTAMSSTVVDDSEPASFAAQSTFNWGMANDALAECAACLMDESVNTPI